MTSLIATPLQVLLAILLAAPLFVVADDRPGQEWHEGERSFELARQAVSRGEALPLQEVLRHLQRVAPGQVVATDYEYEFDRWVYEFRIVDGQGRIRKVHLDARSGELVEIADD